MPSGRATEEKRAVGKRVAQARRRAGLTQKQLADLVGVGERAVQGWELGQSHPYRRLATLERVLNIDRDWLLHGRGARRLSAGAVEVEDFLPLESQMQELDQEIVNKSAGRSSVPPGLERRLRAIEERLDRLERR